MTPDQSKSLKVVQTAIALLLVPALWPLTFIGVAMLLPGVIDPLLGGAQNILYLPGLIWLLVLLVTTAAIAALFRLKRTHLLFLVTSIACPLILAAGLSAVVAGGDHRFYHTSYASYALSMFIESATFLTGVSFVTALVFVSIGGYRHWQSK